MEIPLTTSTVPVPQATYAKRATPATARYLGALLTYAAALAGYVWDELYTVYRVLTIVALGTIAASAYALLFLA